MGREGPGTITSLTSSRIANVRPFQSFLHDAGPPEKWHSVKVSAGRDDGERTPLGLIPSPSRMAPRVTPRCVIAHLPGGWSGFACRAAPTVHAAASSG